MATKKKSSSKTAKKAAPRGAKKKATRPRAAAAKKASVKKAGVKKVGAKKRSAKRATKKASAKKAATKKAATKKAATKKAAVRKAAPVASAKKTPKFAREVLARSRARSDVRGDLAFFDRPRSRDDLAEELGEEVVTKMTSGADQGDRLLDLEVEEERGGPFVRTKRRDEYARGTDASNPRDATREPFPTV